MRVLSLIDEFTREWISLTVARSLKAHDVLAALKRAIAERGIPGHIRSDNGPEFIAGITRQYLSENGIKTLYIEPGSPWQNGHVESFHNRLRDRTGAKSTIGSTRTAISDSFPQICLPNTGNKLNKESLVPVRLRLPYTKDSYQNQLYNPYEHSPARVSFDLVRSLGSGHTALAAILFNRCYDSN